MMIAAVVIAVFFLAYSNGANDVFKGVATLYGSKTATYRGALAWATVSTFAGCLVSVVFAAALARAFTGAGLIPDDLAGSPALLLAVGTAGAVTILAATVIGMPTSTTHALIGALVGAGLVAGSGRVDWSVLLTKFAQPLLVSPLIAAALAAGLYTVLARVRRRLGIERETCLCVHGAKPTLIAAPSLVGGSARAAVLAPAPAPEIVIDSGSACVERYSGNVSGIDAQRAVDVVHFASGGAVCFARAVNDTPKIAALLLATQMTNPSVVLLIVAVAMTAGGVIGSRRVAETMSNRITELNCGQGLTANLTTAGLVLIASRLGMPVSTTHVSCSSIFGIGMVNGRRRWKTIAGILVTWVTTLPVGMGIGALVYWCVA